MENKVIEGPQQHKQGFITFSKSTIPHSIDLEEVIEPIQDTTFITTSTVKSSSHHTPYALNENDNFYLVKSHTPGVRDKNKWTSKLMKMINQSKLQQKVSHKLRKMEP
ncbi:unnamed protein product [Rhizophagus irregularis]|nr:unnamed protein product [Rhizophagus irregularis]CAB5391964.1 unnamed protein product [Rhizophagus irregularis]